jgi:hypothetical protein
LPARVEGATRVVRLVVLTIVELENVFFDNKFKQAGEYISAESASEGLHDPKELREFQE